MDRFDLYELCTQSPERDVALLRAIHGGRPLRLGEDFAGTAALARAWVRRVRGGSAVAVERDPEPLARALPGGRGAGARLRAIVADVRTVSVPVDLLVALNFSIGEWHGRDELVAYLRHARRRLRPGGLFAADLYGGDGAWRTGRLVERHRGPRGEPIAYTWEQRQADAWTGRVVNALHFRVGVAAPGPGRPAASRLLRDAFVYDWRLWSVPELRDACHDAGFHSTEVYSRFEHAVDGRGRVHVRPLHAGDSAGSSFCVFVAARR